MSGKANRSPFTRETSLDSSEVRENALTSTRDKYLGGTTRRAHVDLLACPLSRFEIVEIYTFNVVPKGDSRFRKAMWRVAFAARYSIAPSKSVRVNERDVMDVGFRVRQLSLADQRSMVSEEDDVNFGKARLVIG